MRIVDLHRRAVEGWQARVEKVDDAQWDDATPCSEWDVRALVNHVVGEDRWTSPLVEGSTIEDVGDRLDGDLLGEDPRGAALAAADEAREAVARKGPEGGTVHLSFGDTPIEEYLWQLTCDHLVHGWDLAAATGQDRTMDPELVEAVSGWLVEREDLLRGAGVIGPRVPGQPEEPQAQLLAAMGRRADW